MESVTKIRLAVFDVAGTTAHDDGLVVEAFQSAMISLGVGADTPELEKMTEYVNATMGERKIDVFTHLCEGDAERANLAHDAFIESYIFRWSMPESCESSMVLLHSLIIYEVKVQRSPLQPVFLERFWQTSSLRCIGSST